MIPTSLICRIIEKYIIITRSEFARLAETFCKNFGNLKPISSAPVGFEMRSLPNTPRVLFGRYFSMNYIATSEFSVLALSGLV